MAASGAGSSLAIPDVSATSLREVLNQGEAASSLFRKVGEDDTIKVALRIRPLNKLEIEKSKGKPEPFMKATSRKQVEVQDRHGGERYFGFDRVMDTSTSQDHVYEEVGRPMVDALLQGINACIMAYGQTGSGKTFTVSGTADAPGLAPRLTRDLFKRLHASTRPFDVRLGAVEIFQNRVYDLFAVSKEPLGVSYDEVSGVSVGGARMTPVYSGGKAEAMLEEAATNRTVYATKMNHVSSRSHAIYVMNVAVKSAAGAVRRGQLYIVDLAGSESVSKTGAEGDRLEEAKFINVSLLYLSRVIRALVEKSKHVPYRDSCLTMLLRNCIGGNARTVLLVNASPSPWNYAESMSAIRFGQNASKIKNTALKNEQLADEELEGALASLTTKVHSNQTLLVQCEAAMRNFKALFRELGMSPEEIEMLADGADEEVEAARQRAEYASELARQKTLDDEAISSSGAVPRAGGRGDEAAASAAAASAGSKGYGAGGAAASGSGAASGAGDAGGAVGADPGHDGAWGLEATGAVGAADGRERERSGSQGSEGSVGRTLSSRNGARLQELIDDPMEGGSPPRLSGGGSGVPAGGIVPGRGRAGAAVSSAAGAGAGGGASPARPPRVHRGGGRAALPQVGGGMDGVVEDMRGDGDGGAAEDLPSFAAPLLTRQTS